VRAKRIVRAVYAFRCGYCGLPESQIGSELTFDHFRPQSQNGTDDIANLVYACHACNEFKGEYWAEEGDARLLHPLTDDLAQHMTEDTNGQLKPLTTLGSVYIERLQLNRPPLVVSRLEQRRLARIESRLEEMTETLQGILAKIQKIQP
jgi:hypothetical protein